MTKEKPAIIISSPSGGGKGTIIRRLMQNNPRLALSVSATTRPMREGEKHGVDYYFLSVEEFRQKIKEGEVVEWEEVYPGKMYGTLRSELERLWADGKIIIFEIDVNGAMHLREEFGDEALLMYITPPSLEVLEQRLRERGTEDPESFQVRMQRAEYELSFQKEFDVVIMNDDLETAVADAEQAISEFLGK